MNSKHTAAHFFLDGLVDLGVEYIFANLGTDHVSLIEELARWNETTPSNRTPCIYYGISIPAEHFDTTEMYR